MLDIPRELFLMICTYLSPQDLAKLTLSRNTYVTTQPVLYRTVKLPTYTALIKFTRTLMQAPVVSHLTQRYSFSGVLLALTKQQINCDSQDYG